MYQFICNLILIILGNLYPGYKLYKLLKVHPTDVDKKVYIHYLKFFVVLAAFNSLQYVGDKVIFWFPLYYELKIIMLLYITLPSSNGFLNLYEKYIKSFLNKREKRIDEAIIRYQKRLEDNFNHYYLLIYNHALKIYKLIVRKMVSYFNSSEMRDNFNYDNVLNIGALPENNNQNVPTDRFYTFPTLRNITRDVDFQDMLQAYSNATNNNEVNETNNSNVQVLSSDEDSETSSLLSNSSTHSHSTSNSNSRNKADKFGFSNARRTPRSNKRFGQTRDNEERERLL